MVFKIALRKFNMLTEMFNKGFKKENRNVKRLKGYIINEINGTIIKLFKGVKKLISLKLLMVTGKLYKKAIMLTFNTLLKQFPLFNKLELIIRPNVVKQE